MFFSIYLEQLNCRYVKDKGVPPAFRSIVDSEKLKKINAYNLSKSRVDQLEHISLDLGLLGLILFGVLAKLDFMSKLIDSYVISGVTFFVIIGLIGSIVSLPFSYYRTFVVEEKYEFNKMTPKCWLTDRIKENALSVLFSFLLLSPVLWFIKTYPEWWWLLGFSAILFMQILLAVIYPILIAPIFNKFEPIKDKELQAKVKKQMEQAGIKIKEILEMDTSKRSKHTNAYFTGLGKTKRIVFYDTLVQSHSHEEILAILAHEAGHFRKKHIIKQLTIFGVSMFGLFYVSSLLLNWDSIPTTFGFPPSHSYIGIFLIFTFWEKCGYFLKPIYMSFSRRFEREADLFSLDLLGSSKAIVDGLKRLATDNLSNLTPHHFYVWFHYSHPPLVERVELIEGAKKSH